MLSSVNVTLITPFSIVQVPVPGYLVHTDETKSSSGSEPMIIGLAIVVLLATAVALLTCFAPSEAQSRFRAGTDASFLENFSVAVYQPMLRLAGQMDRRFITSAHGKVLAECYRGIQRNLLREYLREASKDFNRLHEIAAAKTLKALSDPEELSAALFEQQMTFALLVWWIEARLLLDRFVPCSIDLKPVVAQIEALAGQTRQLARPQYAAYSAY